LVRVWLKRDLYGELTKEQIQDLIDRRWRDQQFGNKLFLFAPSDNSRVGACGEVLTAKVWKNNRGHTIKCEARGGQAMNYWASDPDIESEVRDFCKSCRFNPEKKQNEPENKMVD